MEASEVLARRLALRSGTVDMGDGKKIFFRRPTEIEQGKLMTIKGSGEDLSVTWSVGIEEVRKYVTGWEGYTAADLLGADIAPADQVTWSQSLWDELCSDNVDWMHKVAKGILDKVMEFRDKRSEVAGNSEPA